MVLGTAAFAAAQATPQYNYPYRVDPNTIPKSDRANDCDADTLLYSCVCETGVSPNITQYSETLPFYICQAWGNQCVLDCGPGANACANDCRVNHPCGAQNPDRSGGPNNFSGPAVSSLASGAASPTKSPSPSIPLTGFGSSSTGSTTSFTSQGGAAGLVVPTAAMGLGALCGSVFLGFAMYL
ncbi:hypothetical protein ACEQ8H_008479 [Pleosporales sp. CAS-2024a]